MRGSPTLKGPAQFIRLSLELCLAYVDEGKPHICSFAKKAVAFFNISRSIRNCLFSLRYCINSCFSAVVNAPSGARPPSTSACLSQARSVGGVTLRFLAIIGIDCPGSWASLIASPLKSGEKVLRVLVFVLDVTDFFKILQVTWFHLI